MSCKLSIAYGHMTLCSLGIIVASQPNGSIKMEVKFYSKQGQAITYLIKRGPNNAVLKGEHFCLYMLLEGETTSIRF